MSNLAKWLIQKAIGILFIAVSVVVIVMASSGKNVTECDITPVFIFAPLGLFFLFTKDIFIL